MLDFSTLRFRKADRTYTQAICDLVNLTYRGTTGWTTEATIIQGNRTNPQEIEAALSKSDAQFLIVQQHSQLIACIYIAREHAHAFIGFFSVHPDWQKCGLGKYLLGYAETYAQNAMGIRKFIMFVISQRSELIAFYQRRGYRLTGQVKSYPLYLGVPRIDGLTIDYLEKIVTT